ncbi:MAG: DUF3617 family protein [Gammaproteobacteria bacterium]|nr:DUF3617 family protein [Gammaproteobacteria bacterium]
MNHSTLMLGTLVAWLACASSPAAADAVPPRLYEVTAETIMPHLEESLRHAVTREQRCLHAHDLADAFPILSHESLKGCRLSDAIHRGHAVDYRLVCTGGNGTTGVARWQLDTDQWRGMLEVKLGGKNMTFYQRVTARPLGACEP